MKKIYQSPELKVVKIQSCQMIAASEYIQIGSRYDGSTTIESRRGGDNWDEDEEDYE